MINNVTTSTNNNVVVVTAPGPSGPVGPQGPQGDRGTVAANSGFLATPFLDVSGSMTVTGSSTFSGDVTITGSLTVSGSNTFINIGPAQFTGSTGILGNLIVNGTSSATLFSGSGASLFDIPASGITGLNLSRVAIGSISASVLTGGNSFIVNNGGTNLFTISNTGLGTLSGGLIVNGSTTNINQGLVVANGATLNGGTTIGTSLSVNGTATVSNLTVGAGGTTTLQGTATLNGAAILTSATVSTNRITDSNISASVSSTGKAFSVNNGATVLASVDQQGAISGSGLNITTGNTLIDSPNIALVGNATLNGQPITTAGDLSLNQIKSGAVTASVSTGGNSFTLENAGTSLFTVSNTGIATISSSINIGNPSDNNYTDGFFDTFTNNTKVSDAIDEISAAFLDLAPAKAGTLVGTNLTVSSPSVFSGYLAGGLNSSDWYVGTSAYSLISNLTSTTTVTLNTPDTNTRFRAGKNSDRVAGTLIGGVSSSKATGSATLSVSSTRALTSGAGSTGTIQITDIALYNTFWAKANARINDTLTVTGSYKYAISADNGAGTTNIYQLWYVGGAGNFPNQTVTAATPVTSSTTFNYLSGIPYLKTATFTLGVTGSNLFNPVYNQNQISFASTYFSTLSTGSNSPNFNDTLLLTVTRTLASNLTSNQNFPTFTITGTKPNKSNATTSPTLVSQKVNSYIFAQSTNTTEYFLDEARRYGDFQTTSWDNTATLTDGDLQVQNGRLINGKVGDYTAFTATTQEYFRALTVNSFASNGSFNFSVSGFSSISPWGSGGALEIAFAKVSDVTGAKTANILWDFGQAFNPSNFGAVRGIVIGSLGLSGTFTLGTVNSGNGSLILYIKYNNVTTANVISQFTISMS
jgi:hypothetical protein